jgi:hypothetical protein
MGASQSSEPVVVLDIETPAPEDNPFEEPRNEPPCEDDNPLNMNWFWPFM